jgi:ANTAR domain/PAS fold
MPDTDPDTQPRRSFTEASEQGSETGTDSYVPQSLDKALLGGAPQRVGTFEYRYDTDTWSWSATVAGMHGYEPGTIQPTTELVLSHKHPDDVNQVKGLLKQSAAPFSSRHRIRTTSGEERKVVVVGDAVYDEDDRVVATRGFYIDVTEAVEAELQDAVGEELRGIVAHREVIEQAKGMLMMLYGIDADAAFAVLRWRSQKLNVKLHAVAAQLVADLPHEVQLASNCRKAADRYLMTLEVDS